MSSIVDIWNNALLNMGKDATITSVTDASVEARAMDAIYEVSRDELLATSDWLFCKKFSGALAPLADDSPNDFYPFWYQTPPDSLRIRAIADFPNPMKPTDFEEFVDDVQGRVFAVALNPVKIIYTRQIIDTELFDPGFTVSLAWLLSGKTALTLTSDPNVMQGMYQGFRRSLGSASSNIQEVRPHRGDAAWILDRE